MFGEAPNYFRFDILARCGLDQQISELAIVGVDDLMAVSTVVIKCPPGEQKSRPLVAFGKPLCSGYTEDKVGGCLNWIVDTVDGTQGGLDSIQFVRLVEPFVAPSNPLVDRDGERIWRLQ